MLKQLRLKFICINMVMVMGMLCIIFGLVYHSMAEGLETESIRMLRDIAEDPYQLGNPFDSGEEVRLPYFMLQISHRGEVIATSGGYYDLSDEEMLQKIVEVAFASNEEIGVLEDYNLRYYRLVTPAMQRIVFADISSELATMENLVRICILIGAVGFIAFLIISIFLARWAVKPVETAWKQQRQFVADASHELKTPLTVILTNAELLQSPDYAPEEKGQFSRSILTMSQQMRGLVERLLELARADNGSIQMTMAPLDLSQLVGDALLPFEPLYFESGLTLMSDIQPGITLRGSDSHLRQVVEILLDNGMKYSTPGGTVYVGLKKQGVHCLLSVSSPGEAISQEDLKNIFKRFYRADKARAMNHSYGLGLSIAESIVTDHKGKIWAESAGGVNTFHVQLPV